MTYRDACKLLREKGQEHLLAFWNDLNVSARRALLSQIAAIDFSSIARMQASLQEGNVKSAVKMTEPKAPNVVELKGVARTRAVRMGEALLHEGKVGILLVAGGQGSRLGFNGPKGCYSVGSVLYRPLFYYHMMKVCELQQKYSVEIPVYIMTSAVNHVETVSFFEKHSYFGLSSKQVHFFQQGTWPALDDAGKIMLADKGNVFQSPDGHGGMLAALKRSGSFADMRKRGVSTLFYFQVDNPLVEVADPAFLGLHVIKKAEYSLKLCAKRDAHEGLGMVVKRGSHWDMIEYTEMTEEMSTRLTSTGDLYFKYGSPAIHVFDRVFLEAEATKDMPLHLAHKKIGTVDVKGRAVKPVEPNGWKFEKFIFDCLKDAKRVALMAFDREEEFSPVKNAQGVDSPETCQQALETKARRHLAKMGITIDKAWKVDLVSQTALIDDGQCYMPHFIVAKR